MLTLENIIFILYILFSFITENTSLSYIIIIMSILVVIELFIGCGRADKHEHCRVTELILVFIISSLSIILFSRYHLQYFNMFLIIMFYLLVVFILSGISKVIKYCFNVLNSRLKNIGFNIGGYNLLLICFLIFIVIVCVIHLPVFFNIFSLKSKIIDFVYSLIFGTEFTEARDKLRRKMERFEKARSEAQEELDMRELQNKEILEHLKNFCEGEAYEFITYIFNSDEILEVIDTFNSNKRFIKFIRDNKNNEKVYESFLNSKKDSDE